MTYVIETSIGYYCGIQPKKGIVISNDLGDAKALSKPEAYRIAKSLMRTGWAGVNVRPVTL